MPDPKDYSSVQSISPWDLQQKDEFGRVVYLPADSDRAAIQEEKRPRLEARLDAGSKDSFKEKLQAAAKAQRAKSAPPSSKAVLPSQRKKTLDEQIKDLEREQGAYWDSVQSEKTAVSPDDAEQFVYQPYGQYK